MIGAFWPLYVAVMTACRWLRGARCAACDARLPFEPGAYCEPCWPHLRRGFARELAVEAARRRNRCGRVA